MNDTQSTMEDEKKPLLITADWIPSKPPSVPRLVGGALHVWERRKEDFRGPLPPRGRVEMDSEGGIHVVGEKLLLTPLAYRFMPPGPPQPRVEIVTEHYPFFFDGLTPASDPAWLKMERIGIEALEKTPGDVQEAYYWHGFPLLLSLRTYPGGFVYVTPGRVASRGAQIAANTACEGCGCPKPFPAIPIEQAEGGVPPTPQQRVLATERQPRRDLKPLWAEWNDERILSELRRGKDKGKPEAFAKKLVIQSIRADSQRILDFVVNEQQIRNRVNRAIKLARICPPKLHGKPSQTVR